MSNQSTPVQLQASDLDRNGGTYCPNPKADMKTWNTHPKVFIAFTDGRGVCPYCGTIYQVDASEQHAGH